MYILLRVLRVRVHACACVCVRMHTCVRTHVRICVLRAQGLSGAVLHTVLAPALLGSSLHQAH